MREQEPFGGEAAQQTQDANLQENEAPAPEAQQEQPPAEPQQEETSPEQAQPEQAEEPEEEEESEPEGFSTPVLFTLEFPIRLEDFIEFHKLMSAGALGKQRRRSILWGGAEVAISALYLILSFTGVFAPMTTFQWILIGVLLAVGLYSLVVGGLFYEKTLRRMLTRQYTQASFHNLKLKMEFHEDGVEEVTNGTHLVTRFADIYGILATPSLFMIRVDPRRSVLIPRATLGEGDAKLDALLTRAAENYGKRRVDQ